MKKILFYLPALLHTGATLCLNVVSGALIPLWHIWNLCFWFSGWLMSRGKGWGCIPGLLPGGMILLLKGGQSAGVETTVALVWTVYYLVCGVRVGRNAKSAKK